MSRHARSYCTNILGSKAQISWVPTFARCFHVILFIPLDSLTR